MKPSLVTPRPQGTRAGATGRFSASFWRFSEGWHSARFQLTTSRLTGPILEAHIHTGSKGRNGPVLVSLSAGRYRLDGGGVLLLPSATVWSWVESMKLLGAYVDVHTKRNPRGELRGQIVMTP